MNPHHENSSKFTFLCIFIMFFPQICMTDDTRWSLDAMAWRWFTFSTCHSHTNEMFTFFVCSMNDWWKEFFPIFSCFFLAFSKNFHQNTHPYTSAPLEPASQTITIIMRRRDENYKLNMYGRFESESPKSFSFCFPLSDDIPSLNSFSWVFRFHCAAATLSHHFSP